MAKSSTPGSYHVFLDSLKRLEAEQATKGGATTRPVAEQPKAAEDGRLKLLATLSAQGPLSLPDLMDASGMEFTAFIEAVEAMRSMGLMTLDNAVEPAVCRLTQTGTDVARRALKSV